MTPDKRKRARELAYEHIAQGDPSGWFERLYQESKEGKSVIPWLKQKPNANLLDFRRDRAGEIPSAGKTALNVGCGMGDDAELLASWGFSTTAFDVAESAIESAKQRFPESPVHYRAADLLHPPAEWSGHFDFVFEAYTIQAMPPEWRDRAIESVASFVKPGGKLLIVARARDEEEHPGDFPWPLSKKEVDRFKAFGLTELSFEDYVDDQTPPEPVRRFRAFYEKRG